VALSSDAALGLVGGPFDASKVGAAWTFVGLRSTQTSVSCSPSTLAAGEDTTCTATVSDTASGAKSVPTGLFAFSDTGASTGTYSCTPAGNGITGQAQCSVTITPTASGTPTIRADYSGDASHNTSHGTTSITVNQIPAHFRFSASSYSVGEGAGTATITVERVGDTSRPATVNFATSDGTASASSDYSPASGSPSFAPGDTSKTFTVSITNDTQPENDETIDLTLTSSTPDVVIDSPGTATLTIVDNDFSLAITGGPDGPTTQTGPSFSFTTDPASGPADICWIDSGTPASCSSPYNSSKLADGPHTFHVQSTLSGATRNASRDFFVDTVAPTVTASFDPKPGFGERLGTGDTFSGIVEIGRQPSDAAPSSGVAEVRCEIDPATAPASIDDIPASACPLITDAVGAHTLYVSARDNALNTRAPVAYHFTIVAPPDTLIIGGPIGKTWESTPSFLFISSPPGGTFRCRIDNGPAVPCESGYTTPELADGDHFIDVTAVSPEGVADPTPAHRSFEVGRTVVHGYHCSVNPFLVPAHGSTLGCGFGASCLTRIACTSFEVCPVGAVCDVALSATFADRDSFVLAASFTHPRGFGEWSVENHIGFGGFGGSACVANALPPNTSAGCTGQSIFKFVGEGKPFNAFCDALPRDYTGPWSFQPGDAGPDSERRLSCDLTFTVSKASALEAAALTADPNTAYWTIHLYTPEGGSLALSWLERQKAASAGFTPLQKRKPGFKTIRKHVTHAGPVAFKIHLSKAGLKTLRRRGTLALTVRATLTPTHGRKITKTQTVKLIAPTSDTFSTRLKTSCAKHPRARRTKACRQLLHR
jgi:hypothetical protein